MNKQEKLGVILGVGGASFGSVLWLVILGIALKSWTISIVPLLLAAIAVVFSIRLYDINPEKKFTVLGAAILWLIIINFVYLNMFYDKIPAMACGISTGKEQCNIVQLNVYLGLLSLIGFIFIIIDILRKKS